MSATNDPPSSPASVESPPIAPTAVVSDWAEEPATTAEEPATTAEEPATTAEEPAAAPPADVPPADVLQPRTQESWLPFGAAASGKHAFDPRASGERRGKELSTRLVVCTLMMVLSFVMVLWNLQDSSRENANTGSRYATIQALVDHGTFWIDNTHYVGTIDKYKVGEHYISSKPPMLSTLGAGCYWLYQAITGKGIGKWEGGVVRFVSLCTGGLFHVVFMVFFYRLSVLLLKREVAILIAMAGACFAYLGVAYATAINNHSPAAALAVCGLYYACAIRHGTEKKLWHWPVAGFVLGLLPTIDLPSLAISGVIGLYLLAHDWKKTLIWFVPAALPPLLVHLALCYQISGSFRPFYLNSELKQFKGFHFRNPGDIDGLREPKHIYAFNVLFGHHGVFSMTPLYLFGLWELGRSLWRRVWLRESLLTLAALCAFFGFYIFRSRNYGGWCVGMRWLVPVMPLLLLYFGLWIDRVRLSRLLWPVVLAAFLVSGFNVQDGLTSPFQFSVWHNWLESAPNRNRVGKVFNVRVPRTRAPR
ncbi:MAG: hypothetical protein RL685_4669 [Pseudomonadota bacterium]